MSFRRALWLTIVTAGILALAAGGLNMTGNGPAWAQGPLPPGAPPPPSAGAPPGSEQPPLPPLEDILAGVRSADLMARQTAVGQLGVVYRTGTNPEREAEIERILRENALHGETPGLRTVAVNGLGARPDRNMAELARAALDPAKEVREAALRVLAAAPPSPAADRALEQLVNSPDVAVAAGALDTLTKRLRLRGAPGVEPLLRLLAVSRTDASAKAALQLVQFGREVMPALLRTLATGSNELQRHAAGTVITMLCGGQTPRQQQFAQMVRSLRHQEPNLLEPDLSALAGLSQALERDPAPLVREVCAQGLGYLSDERCAPPLVRALLQDPAEEVRVRAAAALVLIPSEGAAGETALAALEQAVAQDRSPRVRRFAAEALGWTNNPRATGALLVATRDADPQVRQIAAQQLGRLQTPEALEPLLALFSDPAEDVRWRAVVAVDRLRDRRAAEALVQATQDPSVLVSNAAQTALQKLGESRRLPLVENETRDSSAGEWERSSRRQPAPAPPPR